MIKQLLKLKSPLPLEISKKRSNCFNAVMLFQEDAKKPDFCGPEEYLSYLQENYKQVDESILDTGHAVVVVWSRSKKSINCTSIRIEELKKEAPGYPFGLVMEHSFVTLDNKLVFHKKDPSRDGRYEKLSFSQAIAPYVSNYGYELTFHKKIDNKSSM